MRNEEFIAWERENYLERQRRRQQRTARRRAQDRRHKVWAIFLFLLAVLLTTFLMRVDAGGAEEQVTVKLENPAPPMAPAAFEVEAQEPSQVTEPEETPAQDCSAEAEELAKTVYGEARGCSTTEQAAVIWCVLNRVDSECAFWPDDIIGVATQPEQFHGYYAGHPVTQEHYELALDVIDRWRREKNGEADVGRVLPPEYLYFHGDGEHNHYRTEYTGGRLWDWSLDSPYEE